VSDALIPCPECGHAVTHHNEDGCAVCDCDLTADEAQSEPDPQGG
jgi:hypothetical protein